MLSLFREIVCETYGITDVEFNSRSKVRRIVEARLLFYKICMEAGIVNKQALAFMGRTTQSARTYQDMLAGDPTESFRKNYEQCKPMAQLIVNRYKKSPTTHLITRYTKAEELMILKAIADAKRYMRHYCALSK